MLNPTLPWGQRVRPYRAAHVVTRVCSSEWQERAYWAIRQQTFVVEQQLFEQHDRDASDERALPIVALTNSAGVLEEVVGVVRIYPVDEGDALAPEASGLWYGGRLAVTAAYRRHGVIGERLIQRAVGTARYLGCKTFLATVQESNVRYFERHHFRQLKWLTLQGLPHALMQADLQAFPPLFYAGTQLETTTGRAA